MPQLIIGIGGCSGSGKTTVSVELLRLLKKEGYKTELIQLDRFFKACPTDWEDPSAIDWEAFYKRIRQVPKDKILILEGFIIYLSKGIDFDIKFLLDMDVSVLARRRAFRSSELRWSEPPDYMEKVVYPSYVKNNKIVLDNIGEYVVEKIPLRHGMIAENFHKRVKALIATKKIKPSKELIKASNIFFEGEELSFE